MTPGQVAAITVCNSYELVHQNEVQNIMGLDNVGLAAVIADGKFPPPYVTNQDGSFWLRKEVVYMRGGWIVYKSELNEMVSIVLAAR